MGSGDSIIGLGLLVGVAYFIYTGDLKKWLDQLAPQLKLPGPPAGGGGAPPPTTTFPMLPTHPPAGGGGGAGPPVTGGQIYRTAGKVCTNVTDGGLEMHGEPRIEPQIACGANFQDAEVTGYFMVPDGSDTISLKMHGPKHSGIPDADMCNNIHYFPFGGNSTKPFGKQIHHTGEYCEFGSPLFPLPNFLGKWIGVKAVEWNQGNTVHMESWIDFPEGSGWKKWAVFDDNGTNNGCKIAKAPFLKSPCSPHPVSIGYRIDGSAGTKYKNLSAREIAPGGGGGPMAAAIMAGTFDDQRPIRISIA